MIKELRTKKNYTQAEMAEKLQISLRHYVRIDNEQSIPRPDVFANLIKRLYSISWGGASLNQVAPKLSLFSNHFTQKPCIFVLFGYT